MKSISTAESLYSAICSSVASYRQQRPFNYCTQIYRDTLQATTHFLEIVVYTCRSLPSENTSAGAKLEPKFSIYLGRRELQRHTQIASHIPIHRAVLSLETVLEFMSMDDNNIVASINNLSLTSSDISTCANCGNYVSNPNVCNKCKSATYCNASCKKRHRSKHKKDCEKRVAELQEEELERKKRAAELHDEKLFKQPPPKEDCPICMLLLPSLDTGSKYKSCCGKIICSGCIHAVKIRDGGVGLCPFCRTPVPTSKKLVEQYKKRVELGDDEGIRNLGCCYSHGMHGLPQNYNKALELWHRAADLGNTASYHSIGNAYYRGNGVERDEKKAIHYFELAAMGGDVNARHNLGAKEGQGGNIDRALKHFMIAVGSGCTNSLEKIKKMFMYGHATKEDYAKVLQTYQAYLGEIKSPQRDQAAAFSDAAFSDDYKYY